MPALQIPAVCERVLTTNARLIVLIGGRGSAKSETVARILLLKSQTEAADVMCGREYQNSIDDSVHKVLCELIQKMGIEGARTTDKKIDFSGGGGFRYKGFARNSAAVKSAQGFKYSWIEEADALSEQSIEDLLPTIRANDSKLFFSANPQASNDPFSKRFIVPFQAALTSQGYYEDDMHLIIMMNWRDNPWHGELETQRLWDFANMSRAKYDHIWEGAFNDTVEDAIIKAEWFDAAIDAHKKLGFEPRGARVVSHDPSDGGDPKALCLRQGSVILDVAEDADKDANDGCDWATAYAIENDADHFTWDCDGLGVTLRRQVSNAFDDKAIDYHMFKGSEGVDYPNAMYEAIEGEARSKARTNKQTFRNKRAQYCWDLRDRYYRTYRAIEKGEYIDPDLLISISSGIDCIDQLRSETCRVPRKTNGTGLIQIMSKPEMLSKHGIKSPNLFDCTFMSLRMPKRKAAESGPVTVPNRKRLQR
jgi:phage terminase large subunit